MFNEKYSTGLEMFSITYFIVIAVCIALLACTIAFRRRFVSPKADRAFRFGLGSLLLTFETVFHIWTAASGGYSWDMWICSPPLRPLRNYQFAYHNRAVHQLPQNH